MEIGAAFPTTQIGTDPEVIRTYANVVEAYGYDHVLTFDHVVGANPDTAGEGSYDARHEIHEPLTLLGYLAGLTEQVELVTGVVVLPQRQTALVAKQAAEIDLVSGGRLRLGVGVGWNAVEYETLGEDFSNRGKRIEEQVDVLRALWTEDLVTLDGTYHTLPDVGINPRPIQQPIPIWMGGTADPVLRRIARMADGWFPQFRPGPEATDQLASLREYIREAGREPEDVGVHGRLRLDSGDPDEWVDRVRAWRDLGATHVSVVTAARDFDDPTEHAECLESFSNTVEDAGFM